MNSDRTPAKSIFGSGNQDDFIRQPSDDPHSKSKVIPNTADNSDNPLESVSKFKYSDNCKKLEHIQTSNDDKLKGKDGDPFKPAKELISNHSPVDGEQVKMEAYFMPDVLQKQKDLAE